MRRVTQCCVAVLSYALAAAGTLVFLMVLPLGFDLDGSLAAVVTAAVFPLVLGVEWLLRHKSRSLLYLLIAGVLWVAATATAAALTVLVMSRESPANTPPAIDLYLGFVSVLMPSLTFWFFLRAIRWFVDFLATRLPWAAPYFVKAVSLKSSTTCLKTKEANGLKPANGFWGWAKYMLTGFCLGTLATLPALLLAFLSAGGGHGDYLWAKVFFPYAMILPVLQGGILSGPLIIFSFIQFSVYGGLIGASMASRKGAITMATIIGTVHAVAATICLIANSRYFSQARKANVDTHRIVRGCVAVLRYALAAAGTFMFLMALPPLPFFEVSRDWFFE